MEVYAFVESREYGFKFDRGLVRNDIVRRLKTVGEGAFGNGKQY